MSKLRLVSIPEGMNWEEFCAKYIKFFPISNLSERQAAMKAKYKELTGKDPDEQKPKKVGKTQGLRGEAKKDNGSKSGIGSVSDHTES